jgi:histidine triad (HIT) family protein
MTDSIFTKIIKRELPSTIRYEDDEFIAFDDIHPQTPIHVLVVPKAQTETLEQIPETNEDFHAKILLVGRKVAKIMGISENYRLAMNVGSDVQAVLHIHLHVMGGWKNLDKAKTEKF